MNKLRRFFQEQQKSLVILGSVLSFTLIFGLVFSAVVLFQTVKSEKLHSENFCLRSECVKAFLSKTEQAFVIAKATLDFSVAIATTGGIFVALLSYFNSVNNSALTNHIEHLKVFSEYLASEIKKRERLSPALIDTLLLYSTIFKQSRSGKTTVSDEYINFLTVLNSIVKNSNERCDTGTPGGFSYREHQRRIRDHMAKVGVTIYTAPRNDYFEMEKQLFSLVSRISQSFCPHGVSPELIKPLYY